MLDVMYTPIKKALDHTGFDINGFNITSCAAILLMLETILQSAYMISQTITEQL
jgi:hypothetical protein